MGKLKAFEIVFENNKNVYFPGDNVAGKCVLELRGGEFKLNQIKILMRGVAKVHWTEPRSTGNRLGSYNEHFSAEIEYFLLKKVLHGDTECGENGELVLDAGCHEFPFSFQLPSSGLPTSFEGKHGSIRYWIKAEVEKRWAFNDKTKKAFTVISKIDINRSEYLTPIANSDEKSLYCWCCTSGPISLYAKTDRRGYCPGESIIITASFENLSNRTVIPHATLCQTQMYVANGKMRCRKTKLTAITGLAIQGGKRGIWDAQLLKIPPVSPSIINCCLIKVDYNIHISLESGIPVDISIDLPIVIGTVPLRSRPPRYTQNESLHYRRPRISPPMLPSYSSLDDLSQDEPPPSYAECISGSVDIRDDDDGDIMGDTLFTPMYTYVNAFELPPPPSYSETDPYPSSFCN